MTEPAISPPPFSPNSRMRFIAAMAIYFVLGVLTASTLKGDFRLTVGLLVGALAVLTSTAYLRARLR